MYIAGLPSAEVLETLWACSSAWGSAPLRGSGEGALVAFCLANGCSREQLLQTAARWREVFVAGFVRRATVRAFVEAVASSLGFGPAIRMGALSPRLQIIAFDCESREPVVFSQRWLPHARVSDALCCAILEEFVEVEIALEYRRSLVNVELFLSPRVLERFMRPRALVMASEERESFLAVLSGHATVHALRKIFSFQRQLMSLASEAIAIDAGLTRVTLGALLSTCVLLCALLFS